MIDYKSAQELDKGHVHILISNDYSLKLACLKTSCVITVSVDALAPNRAKSSAYTIQITISKLFLWPLKISNTFSLMGRYQNEISLDIAELRELILLIGVWVEVGMVGSLHLKSSTNEFSWHLIFADADKVPHSVVYFKFKFNTSLLLYFINTMVTMDKPSANL